MSKSAGHVCLQEAGLGSYAIQQLHVFILVGSRNGKLAPKVHELAKGSLNACLIWQPILHADG
jgi:hypothetical protein